MALNVREYERVLEELELRRDIHAAEDQLTREEGVPHEVARESVLAALDED